MGEMREYYWSELFLVFVPDEKEKTLAEMSLEEYQDWRAQIYPDSYVSKFAEWFSVVCKYKATRLKCFFSEI